MEACAFVTFLHSYIPFFSITFVIYVFFILPNFPLLSLGKASADPNAAWAAYYAQYYGQQPGGAMAAQAPGASAAAPPGDQSQAAQTTGGQPDYTKAWEEYYKKMGMSMCDFLTIVYLGMYCG